MAELTEEEAWEQAERNTFEDVRFIELDQFVHDEYGIEGEEDEDDRAYILTNTVYGRGNGLEIRKVISAEAVQFEPAVLRFHDLSL